jgi:hypothetical protein
MRFPFVISRITAVALVAIISSCDPHIPPSIEFKTGGNYTSADVSVAPGSSITVGVIGKKKEDDMKTFNVSYAYDGAKSTTTKETFTLTGDEEKNYEKDYTFTVRNQPGIEDWYFVITDRDGNIAKLHLTITVN